MKFEYDCEKVLECDQDGYKILDPKNFNTNQIRNYLTVCRIIDTIGNHSSSFRGLKSNILRSDKFFANDNNGDKLLIKAKDDIIIGFIKIGIRKLFLSNESGYAEEHEAQCILDFFIHPTYQRRGFGKLLFNKMLNYLKVNPNKLAYDSPTTAMLNFLRKFYSLENYIKQNNNFVIYEGFMKENKQCKSEVDYNYVLRHQLSKNNINYEKEQITKSPNFSKNNLQLSGASIINDLSKYNPVNKNYRQHERNQINRSANNLTEIYSRGSPIPTPSSVETFNLLNCKVEKKFFNYFLNTSGLNSPINGNSRLNSGRKNDDAFEFQNKFNEHNYLKNKIETNVNTILFKENKIDELKNQVYRNPTPVFYGYKKNMDWATVSKN